MGFFCCIHSCKIFMCSNVTKTHSFAPMLFKRSHINKAVSAAMLVILLLIHSIKLLHSHSNDNFCSDSRSAIIKSFSDCSICSYQVNKDADYPFCPAISEYEVELISFNTSLITLYNDSFHTAFETRGPPAI